MKTRSQALARVSKGQIRPYSTYNFGRERNDQCLSIILPKAGTRSLLPELRNQLPPSSVAFIGTTQWYGNEQHEGAELVVGSGNSQFDILRLAKSDAANYGLDTEDLVKKLQEYDRNYGINIFHAETDTIEFELLSLPRNLSAFATDLYKFCPNIVNQGVGSVSALEESIEALGEVYLWWD